MRSLHAVSAAAFAAGVLAFAGAAGAAAPAAIEHFGAPTAGIATAVFVPAGADTMYVSGMTPPATSAAGVTPAVYGDTETQTIGVLKRIEDALKAKGMTMADVVMLRVLLVNDPAKGGMDFAGMNKGYATFFGTATQPNKPARITSQITQLVNPAFLVEIEAQAARMPK
jgi:enamine deaminase RidA (YjgF/YER057c/UK114 family)